MKTVYIVRHAKSSWEDMTLSDHDRPLLPVGVKRTKKIAEFLKNKKIHPEVMLSSSAVRALETAKIIARETGFPVEKIKIEERLYHASEETILEELSALPDKIESAMVFGHNPTLTWFVSRYIKTGIDNLPTSGVVGIQYKTDRWENVANARSKVRLIIFPRMLK
ncbi:MAG: histidine phosphatase family protein [Chlorobi bacterium]|nr:histidine phosphatase family protein [Chlorobiota bacterium]